MARLQILGLSLSTPEPYAKGHVCSAAEAATLNAALTRGLAKALYRELKEVSQERETLQGSEEDLARCQALIASFVKGFSEGHERLAAIQSEARRIGRARAEAAVYRTGKRLEALAKGEQEELIAREAARSEVLAEATRRIDHMRSIGTASALEELAGEPS